MWNSVHITSARDEKYRVPYVCRWDHFVTNCTRMLYELQM
jgi:hypothetical protein